MWYFDRDEHARARATGTASDDATEALEADAVQRQIGKLEERRDTLVRRKQALRELIVSQTRAKLMSGA